MIEDKELGVKIAENQDEKIWHSLKKEAEMLIKQSENNIKIQKGILWLADVKIKELERGQSK